MGNQWENQCVHSGFVSMGGVGTGPDTVNTSNHLVTGIYQGNGISDSLLCVHTSTISQFFAILQQQNTEAQK